MNRYIIANWKANKTIEEAKDWLTAFNEKLAGSSISSEKTIIICPPFTLLPVVSQTIRELHLPLKVGAQNISLFPGGAFTGEVTGKHIKEFAEYVIIGHTERRMHFHEEYAVLSEKARRAFEAGLTPIYCVQDIEVPLVDGVTILSYEPVSAIGTGQPDTPENAAHIAKAIKEKMRQPVSILYGGSVTPENVQSFMQKDEIGGVLVGGSSLDPSLFFAIVEKA